MTWPTKAPRATPEPPPPGSLAPGEANLKIEAFADESVFGGTGRVTLRHAVAVGTGFVVLGEVSQGAGVATGHAWLSPDGRAWERVDVPAMDRAFAINDLAAAADGTLIAIGLGTTDGAALVWRSPDHGRTWETTRIDDVEGTMQLGRVVAGRGALLLLGSRGTLPAREGDSRLWWSDDGRQWTPVEMPRDVFGDVDIHDIAATSSGFVAVGARSSGGEPPPVDPFRGERAAAWTSADGVSWMRSDVPDAPPLVAVVAGDRAMLAAGFGEGAAGTIQWRSTDGRVWQGGDGGDDTGKDALFVWHGALYRLGTDWSSGGPVLELSMSEDGSAWRRIGATLETRTGGIGGEAVPGEPGILQRGERGTAGVIWLIGWPAS